MVWFTNGMFARGLIVIPPVGTISEHFMPKEQCNLKTRLNQDQLEKKLASSRIILTFR